MPGKELSKISKLAANRTHPYAATVSKGAPFLSLKTAMSNSLIHDEEIVVIRDKYPKAKHHFLLLPKEHHNHEELKGVTSLRGKHISLVEQMISLAVEMMEKEAPGVCYQMGFHSIPSMTPLHMHVISTDFESPWLKNKKHWNTFTSDFFLAAVDVLEKLKTDGKIVVNRQQAEEAMKKPLECRWCGGLIFKTIPDLKKHLVTTDHRNNLLKK